MRGFLHGRCSVRIPSLGHLHFGRAQRPQYMISLVTRINHCVTHVTKNHEWSLSVHLSVRFKQELLKANLADSNVASLPYTSKIRAELIKVSVTRCECVCQAGNWEQRELFSLFLISKICTSSHLELFVSVNLELNWYYHL